MKKYFTKDHFWLGLKYCLIALFLGILIRGFILIPVRVQGNSMDQTLKQGDMIVMEKLSKIHRFDIIVFKKDDGLIYIKRVIGLPGDKIRYSKDQLYINDQKVPEKFLTNNKNRDNNLAAYTTDFQLKELINKERLPADEYFVLGDNRRVSKDSRSFGTVEDQEILGKARFVYYPFFEMKLV